MLRFCALTRDVHTDFESGRGLKIYLGSESNLCFHQPQIESGGDSICSAFVH